MHAALASNAYSLGVPRITLFNDVNVIGALRGSVYQETAETNKNINFKRSSLDLFDPLKNALGSSDIAKWCVTAPVKEVHQ